MINDKYDDIINLEHYVSKNRAPMSMKNRASQFIPFSALNGYAEAIKETARLTNKRIEIDSELRETINLKLQMIKKQIKLKPNVNITYFIPDKKKKGGKYVTLDGIVKKINENNRIIVLEDNVKIPMQKIISIIGNTVKLENRFYE